jgi:hypothetical protein
VMAPWPARRLCSSSTPAGKSVAVSFIAAARGSGTRLTTNSRRAWDVGQRGPSVRRRGCPRRRRSPVDGHRSSLKNENGAALTRPSGVGRHHPGDRPWHHRWR